MSVKSTEMPTIGKLTVPFYSGSDKKTQNFGYIYGNVANGDETFYSILSAAASQEGASSDIVELSNFCAYTRSLNQAVLNWIDYLASLSDDTYNANELVITYSEPLNEYQPYTTKEGDLDG